MANRCGNNLKHENEAEWPWLVVETPSGKRNLNININAQQAILKACFDMYAFKIACWALIFIFRHKTYMLTLQLYSSSRVILKIGPTENHNNMRNHGHTYMIKYSSLIR